MTSSIFTRKWTIRTSPHKITKTGQFPTEIISFQASNQVKLGDDISSTVQMIKCFLSELGKNYTLQSSNTQSNIPKQEVTVRFWRLSLWHTAAKQMDWSHPYKTTDGEDLWSLFNQYYDLISPNPDSLATEDSHHQWIFNRRHKCDIPCHSSTTC